MTLKRAICAKTALAACALLLAGSPLSAQSPRPDTVTMTGKPKTGPVAWDRIAGNWKLFKGKVQKQWGKLTNDDLDVIKGNRRELAGRLQERYGQAQDAAEKDIDTWLSRH